MSMEVLIGLPEFGSEGIKMARHHTKDRDDNPNDSPTIDPAETELIREFIGKFFFSPLKKIVLPLFEQGRIRPVIDSIFPLERVVEAHAHMEANKNFGKIILRIL